MPAQITALPTPPSTSDPTNFNTRADAFLGQMPTFVTEANALAGEVYGLAVQVTQDKATAVGAASTATAKAALAADQVTLAAGQVTLAGVQAGVATTKASDAAAILTQVQNVAAGISFSTKSVSSNTIGTGPKTWTVDAGESFVEGMPIYVVAHGDPTRFMVGVCTGYAGTILSVAVTQISSAGGTLSNWDISIGGVPGVPGAGFPSGGVAGQFLRKRSGVDFDTEWAVDPASYLFLWQQQGA
ncbi:hypothetical protein [Caulobacter sp. FWC2]|uniref:hypothetical protein n=1 Tax=Caulobacter sp. FWC2 TaxID=69664 RepID=UPI000C16080D|nr:hypothetical protein [Caulobacter sp. FWC2]PIB91406.1 hypothetical protein CSW62_07335 [Caulobacter sp. FWC2]